MAQLVLDLSQFKSSGVYTVEVDQSERIVVTTQSLRLLPGFSSVGPFNVPVFIRSTRDRQKFFGTIDTKLERKGSFFHRSIDTCLLQSPVFAINLLNVNSAPIATNTDTVGLVALSVDSSISNKNINTDYYVNFFNRERFWKPDPEYLQGVAQNVYSATTADSAPILDIANVGTKTLSFIVRKAVGLQGYNVYAKDWYGSNTNIPYDWIRPYDLMKDYFIQLLAIEGDWTNYAGLSVDPIFSVYFNGDGLIPSKMNDFLNLPQISLVGSWYGTIIPDFKDQTGADQYIENVVNAAVSFTGVLVNVNKAALDNLTWNSGARVWQVGDTSAAGSAATYQVDLVGHAFAQQLSADVSTTFLSYKIDVAQAVLHTTINATIYPVGDTTGKSFSVDSSTAGAPYVTVGSLVKSNANIPGVTYITGKTYDGSAYIITTAEAVTLDGGATFTIQKPIDDASVATAYKFLKLPGLTLTNRHLPGFDTNGAGNAEAGVSKIYAMLDDQGIMRGLTNPDMIQYRYVVDTMAYGLGPNCGGKVYLSRLAKARGKTTALISAPSIAQFASSQNPYFCDTFIPGVDPKPIFNTQWIAQGGNPDMPRSFRFSLPDEDNGGKYCGVFGPFLVYAVDGLLLNIPPAADISNSYVRKFLGGNPYAIVANQNGIISNPNVSGTEYAIDKYDRDYLEPFGYNSIIQRPTTGQVLIYANATSYQNVKSDYNYLHVRELLNTIELQVEEVLKNYVFALNNAVTRLNIVNSVTPILESIKDAGALYKYEVVMDETNNTGTIVDEGFAIIDIGVWITKGMQKIINRITVNKLGTVSNGGFTAA